MNRRLVWTVVIALCLVVYCGQAQHPVISELLASNGSTIADEDGENSDWIELFNPSQTPIQLRGYGLGDKKNYAAAWKFPDTVLQPGASLLVWASGKNRTRAGYYGIEASGAGIGGKDTVDSFHYEYLPLTGKFEIKVRLRSLSGSVADAMAGLMIRDNLTAASRYAGGFATARDRYVTKVRRDTVPGPEASAFTEMRGSLDFPHTWLRLYRDADTIIVHQSIDGVSWQWFYTYFLSFARDTVYAGIASASYNPAAPVTSRWTDLTINDVPVSFSALSQQDIGSGSEGRNFSSAELHSNFALSREGETLWLWDNGGNLVDSISFGPQHTDISCGRTEPGGNVVLFVPPTPGVQNTQGYETVAAPPQCLPVGGVFDHDVPVQLVANEQNARIYYTLDGTDPSELSLVYSGEPLVFTHTQVLRARTIVSGKHTSAIVTHTYFIREPATELPLVSVTSEPRYFWSDSLGIFALGPNASPDYPYYGANFWLDREVPAHLGFYEPGGGGTTFDAGIKIHGLGTRILPQRSLRATARSRYGTDLIRYPLFPALAVQEFNSIILRNGGNDWTFTFLRDPLMAVLCAPLGLDVQAYRPCRSYLNGEYWGLINLRERIDEHYIEQHYAVSPDSVDILENMAVATAGSAQDYMLFLDSLAAGTSGNEDDYIRSQIDVENYLDYNCAELYAGNSDWPGNNVRLWRARERDNRWRWFVYDVDAGFGFNDDYRFNTLAFALSPHETKWTNPEWSTFLLRKVLASSAFRIQFINRFADLLNSAFHPSHVVPVIDSLAGDIAAEVPLHHDRWDSSLANWSSEVEKLRDFARRRPSYVRRHILEQFALPDTTIVRLQVDDESRGAIRINTLTPTSFPFEGVYFQGVPVPITAIAKPGYTFAGWSDPSLPDTSSVSVVFTQDTVTLTAYFTVGQTPVEQIVINEIMYKPADARDCRDWVELYNAGESTTDISNWRLTDDNDKHVFTFPNGTVLLPGSFLLVCEDVTSFKSFYPDVAPVVGNLSFGLGSDNDMVRLYTSQSVLMDSVSYRATAPWPVGALGTGNSIELRGPLLDNTLGENWQTSVLPVGSPGAPNGGVVSVSATSRDNAGLRCSPMPVTSTARVEYTLPQAAAVQLTVCDYLGNPLVVLVAQDEDAGLHTALLNTGAFSAGMYILRLEIITVAGCTIQTLPVVFLP